MRKRRRRRRDAEPKAELPLHVLLSQHLEAAKRAKVDGDGAAFVSALLAFEQSCPDGDPSALQQMFEKY